MSIGLRSQSTATLVFAKAARRFSVAICTSEKYSKYDFLEVQELWKLLQH